MKLFILKNGKIIFSTSREAMKTEPEPALSEKGKQQSKYVAKRLAHLQITKVYVSNAQRALETYAAYKQIRPSVPVVMSDKLKEIYRGVVGGPPRKGTSRNREKNDKQRAKAILKKILNDAQEDDAILLFIHGNLIRYILAYFLQISKANLWEELEIHDASISLIDITNNKPQVRLINSIEHLGKEEVEEFYNAYTKTEYLP